MRIARNKTTGCDAAKQMEEKRIGNGTIGTPTSHKDKKTWNVSSQKTTHAHDTGRRSALNQRLHASNRAPQRENNIGKERTPGMAALGLTSALS